ncbi:hypothetical protein BGW36DRAFT_400216 [Talaromyces proteolyticus]|uniref:WD repeat protein n=1 Tax=Talaromyces proteolyticus TaxID=1131652 RepID=A0AAD4PWL5_9EURO|nr:uncharacterized protein BGW36DRAFT_400216 [Talaromyces proteolyticus]KAH8692127.1 hypothetical protein BGW36DRAFT_400216 [Talaromyces proteolyticus]
MEESLGAGFDRIRATVIPPTNFESSITMSPLLTRTMSDLENPAYLRLTSIDHGDGSEQTFFTNRAHADSESSHIPDSDESDNLDLEMPHDLDQSSRSTNSEIAERMPHLASILQQFTNASTMEAECDDDNEDRLVEDYDSLTFDYSSPVTDSDDEGSDPDDTRKFYTGMYTRIGNLDDDDTDYDDNMDNEESWYGDEFRNSDRYWGIMEPEETVDTHFAAPPTYERNLTIEQFIRLWRIRSTMTDNDQERFNFPQPDIEAANVAFWDRPERIISPQDHDADFYDIQQIPWREKLNVRREDARILRDAWYTPYRNLNYSRNGFQQRLPSSEVYFRPKAMYTNLRATIEHFQLRNLMSVTASNTVQFAHESRLVSWIPTYDTVSCPIDLSQPAIETGFQGPVKISTIRSKFGVAVVGGFCGEYAMHVEGSQMGNTYGLVTKHINGITNHIDITQNRTNSSPMIVFASNDEHIRVLDCATNKFISDHELSKPVNCTETSVDGRLRIVIGDSPEACVLEADSGRPVQRLRGHRDFGFACAWSPDMLHIATSNQDKTVNIWDVRMWRILQSMDSDRAGYRSLRFSPLGGGPRTLLMCEPADRIAIVNAQTYETRQVHDFFGEIGGADYTPDGTSIWVANTDDLFGGFMEFERSQYGLRYGSTSGVGGSSSNKRRRNASSNDDDSFTPHWYHDLPHEWMTEAGLASNPRCISSTRERDLRFMQGLSDEARDNLLI